MLALAFGCAFASTATRPHENGSIKVTPAGKRMVNELFPYDNNAALIPTESLVPLKLENRIARVNESREKICHKLFKHKTYTPLGTPPYYKSLTEEQKKAFTLNYSVPLQDYYRNDVYKME